MEGTNPSRFDCTFTVQMRPVAQERARAALTRDGKPFMYTPKNTVQAQKEFNLLSGKHVPPQPLAGPLALNITFRFPIPDSHKLTIPGDRYFPKGRHDLDNLAKMVMDAMTKAGWWEDDGQVALLRTEKLYDHLPSITVRVVSLKR